MDEIESIRLVSDTGIEADILSYGATLQSLRVPGRDGRLADVVLGYDWAADYLTHRSFFGATIGRVVNRIAGAKFFLDGREYEVARNEGPNSLHGGPNGFDTVFWSVSDRDAHRVRLNHVSPHGTAGYPGTLAVILTYSLAGDALVLDYEARTDRPTLVNLTHHSFFNLAGAAASAGILDHRLTVAAQHFLPVDAGAIPLGREVPVAGTPFDFRSGARLRERVLNRNDPQIAIGGGIDHTFCLDAAGSAPFDRAPRFAARLEDPLSGRIMEVLTTEPGVQIYTGNFLDDSLIGKGGRSYCRHYGICLECQHYPDSPNRPQFPSIRLDPGAVYRQKTIYTFSLAGK